jgi:hypothetical protein
VNEKKCKELRRLTRQAGSVGTNYIEVNKREKLLFAPNPEHDVAQLALGILPATYVSSTRLLANGDRGRYQKMKRQLRK